MVDQVRVFVSHHHSAEEDAFTARLVADLEAAGADVWVDDQRITSDDFIKKINEGLAGRQWLVLAMTPEALRSQWVQAEVNAALNQMRKGRMLGVVPIVAKPCNDEDIPPLLDALHRYDATRAYEPARDGMLRALGLTPAHYPLPDVPERLAALGFRGVNVTGTPAIVPPLVNVAAGPFLMGSNPRQDKDAKRNEQPQHWVELASFQIGKYPVTVAEYALAVQAGAVREPPYAIDPGTWQEQLQRLDHPVVNVTWQDAMDYTFWLRKATRQANWRLPSEAEWEKAARWDAGYGTSRIYPWGDAFDQRRCNTSESRPSSTTWDDDSFDSFLLTDESANYWKTRKTTTPIGSHPANDPYRNGASPCGAEDMAGNIFEWTSSLLRPYPYIPTDGREDQQSPGHRIPRGGCWVDMYTVARTAYRSALGSDVNYKRGLRLAFS